MIKTPGGLMPVLPAIIILSFENLLQLMLAKIVDFRQPFEFGKLRLVKGVALRESAVRCYHAILCQ